MRLLIQRVKKASVEVDKKEIAFIGTGLLVLAGIGPETDEEMLKKAVHKLVNLRIFEDEAGKMNLPVKDIGGELLVISQFTLYANVKRGLRPGFKNAAPPEAAARLFDELIRLLKEQPLKKVAAGQFGADMQVSLINDGPVTIWIEASDL